MNEIIASSDLVLVQNILMNVSKNTDHNFAGLEGLGSVTVHQNQWQIQNVLKEGTQVARMPKNFELRPQYY